MRAMIIVRAQRASRSSGRPLSFTVRRHYGSRSRSRPPHRPHSAGRRIQRSTHRQGFDEVEPVGPILASLPLSQRKPRYVLDLRMALPGSWNARNFSRSYVESGTIAVGVWSARRVLVPSNNRWSDREG